jgi:hypothetical protein
MSLAGSIKAVIPSMLVAGCLLAGCGGGAGPPSETVSQIPAVTAPQVATPTRQQKSAGATTATQAQPTTAAPTGTSTGASSRGRASRRGGSSQPVKETKAQRQKQKSCEKQTAHLPPDQQRGALAECLSPTPQTPEAPETSEQR